MSSQDTTAPKRRSAAANRRRKRRASSRSSEPSVQTDTSTATGQESRAERKAAARDEAGATPESGSPQEKHLRRQQDRREAKSRQPDKKGGLGRFVNTQRFSGVFDFYNATVSEIRRVQWPDRETTMNLSVLVIALSTVLGLVLGGIDYVLFQVFEAMS